MSKKEDQRFIAVYSGTKKRFDLIFHILKERGIVRIADDLVKISLELLEKEFNIQNNKRGYI